ncbi:MAG: RHS repeat domain-containing protein, partial [Acidobacteriota bacterium]
MKVLPDNGVSQTQSAHPGKPVNPTNGNMWLQELDYTLPVIGERIEVNRFYNSINQDTGLFGLGWTTKYDEFIEGFTDPNVDASSILGVHLPDGRVDYFGRTSSTGAYFELIAGNGDQLVKTTNGSYTLNFKDGRIHQFDAIGKLLWQKDRNGNQTTLSYDINNHLTGVTDAFGHVLTLTTNLNGDGTVTQISDTTGVIADYEYYTGTTELKAVTYHDGSKYKFEYVDKTIGGQVKTYLATVKDALDNVLETHLYDDGTGYATTSEIAGSNEKYVFNYDHIHDQAPYTAVSHKKNIGDPDIVTKYYFDQSRQRNLITKIEGICGCGGSGSEVTTYEYDNRLNPTKIMDAAGHSTIYT